MHKQTRRVALSTADGWQNIQVGRVEDWDAVAQVLLKDLEPGSIITLSGQMGAGKTTLVQSLAKLAGAQKRALSPTFALMRVYKVKHKDVRRLVHVDVYRLDNERDLSALNLDEELSEPGTVLVIEWPENIKKWLTGKKIVKVLIK